jgi:hypothetical protein
MRKNPADNKYHLGTRTRYAASRTLADSPVGSSQVVFLIVPIDEIIFLTSASFGCQIATSCDFSQSSIAGSKVSNGGCINENPNADFHDNFIARTRLFKMKIPNDSASTSAILVRTGDHAMIHFEFFFRSPGCSTLAAVLASRSNRTTWVKIRSILHAVFAEVSRNSYPKESARFRPSSADTSLS